MGELEGLHMYYWLYVLSKKKKNVLLAICNLKLENIYGGE
jgi:hypothetical protein